MPRPKNKTELISQSQKNFGELLELANKLPVKKSNNPLFKNNWSVKDLLAHLCAWHKMVLKWHKLGMAGSKPQMPAPGYTWKDTPRLNQKIFQEHKNDSWGKVLKDFKASHAEIMELIKKYSDKDLFTKKLYPWTGSTSMGSYFVSATSSHYQWAIVKIKKAKEI